MGFSFSPSNNVHEIVFDDNFEDTLQLLQHQANITSKKEDTRKKEDRPHIPSELWCQLSEDVRLWYLGYNKAEIVKFLEKKKGYQGNTPQRKAQQHEIQQTLVIVK